MLITRPSSDQTATPAGTRRAAGRPGPRCSRQVVNGARTAPTATATPDALAPAPAPGRVSRYGAFLSLRVDTADGVSNGVKRALQVATSLGGFSTSVHASSEGKAASADLTLRIPRAHVQEAITRLSALGTITGEQVDVQDLTTQLNAGDRTIARLAEAARHTPRRAGERPRSAQRSRRSPRTSCGSSASRRRRERAAHYATVQMHLETPPVAQPSHHNGPLHGLGVAFHWIWIGAVYASRSAHRSLLLVGARLVRGARWSARRRVDALLSRP